MRQASNTSRADWLPTGQAAIQLGVSPCTLKRYAKRDGILQEGIHFRRGPHANSALIWHVPRCFQSLGSAHQH